jgi:ribosomal subunit interface protein
MNIIVRGVHVRVTPAIEAYVHKHLGAPLGRLYLNPATQMDVLLCDNNGPKGGQDKECRVTVHVPYAASLHVSESTGNLYESICLARDRLERAAKRLRGRRRAPKRRARGRMQGRGTQLTEGDTPVLP